MSHIHPRTLKVSREQKNFSQDQLAAASRVSKKQISRLEQGTERKKCHAPTLSRLSKALGVSEADLGNPPQADPDARAEALGLKRISYYLTEQDRLHYRFLEAKYGVQSHCILRATPLLFLVVAEIFLAERSRAAKEFNAALADVPEHHLEHLRDVRIGIDRAERAVLAEEHSIAAKDLSGKTFRDDEWSERYEGKGDLFVEFLAQKVRELCPDIANGDLDQIAGSFEALRLHLFYQEIQELSNGDQFAELALTSGDVHPKDIPAGLLAEDQGAARTAWLSKRCSEETRRAHEERMAKLPSLRSN